MLFQFNGPKDKCEVQRMVTVYGLGQFCLEKATLIPAQGAGGDMFSGCLLYGGLWERFHFLPRDPEGTQKCAKANNKFHSVATSDRLSEQCQLVGRSSLSPSECNQRWWENSRSGPASNVSPLNLIINAIRLCLRYKAQKPDLWASENRVQEWCFIMWCTPFHISTSQG